MKVIANQGERCPKEGQPRQYITDSAPVEVAETSYYRRLVREGSLRVFVEEHIQPAAKKSAKGGDK